MHWRGLHCPFCHGLVCIYFVRDGELGTKGTNLGTKRTERTKLRTDLGPKGQNINFFLQAEIQKYMTIKVDFSQSQHFKVEDISC